MGRIDTGSLQNLLRTLATFTNQQLSLSWLTATEDGGYEMQQLDTGLHILNDKKPWRVYSSWIRANETYMADLYDEKLKGTYIVTPTEEFGGISNKQRGGIGHSGNYVGVAGLNPSACLLLAAISLYMFEFNSAMPTPQMIIHHVGVRTRSMDEYTSLITGLEGVAYKEDDHISFYQRGPITREIQFFPKILDSSIHIDISFPTSQNATGFLSWLKAVTGINPMRMNMTRRTLGSVWVGLPNGTDKLGIKVRGNNWDPFTSGQNE